MSTEGKIKIALFLEPEVARELKVRTAQAGYHGVSDYITQLLIDTRTVPVVQAVRL